MTEPVRDAEYVCPRCGNRLEGDWGDSRGVLWICYACEEGGEEGQTAWYTEELPLNDDPDTDDRG